MHNEQVYTPQWMVRYMLDAVGYTTGNIRKKYIIDNSCGDGAFLCEIVIRYINECFLTGVDKETIGCELSEFIYGIEKDSDELEKARTRLTDIANTYGIHVDFWDLHNEDTLYVDRYDGMFDFVVGNPPYCKVHDLGEQYGKVKNYRYAKDGMTDLYLVFFEIGLNMLNENGKLVYITPSSWTNSLAGKTFRQDCINNGYIKEIHDFKHNQIFKDVTTFTMVSVLTKKRNQNTTVYGYEDNMFLSYKNQIVLNDRHIGGNLYFCESNLFKILKDVNKCNGKKYVVKNGFATLNDKFFLVDDDCPTQNTIEVIKASKCIKYRMFYPYDRKGKPLSYKDLDNTTIEYMKNKAELYNVNTEDDDWYLYGRTQALCDVYKRKYVMNYIVKTVDDIKVCVADEGVGVYSGFYILDKEYDTDFESIVKTNNFINYVKSLCKYKNGGYYTFNTKDLEKYLNFLVR